MLTSTQGGLWALAALAWTSCLEQAALAGQLSLALAIWGQQTAAALLGPGRNEASLVGSSCSSPTQGGWLPQARL